MQAGAGSDKEMEMSEIIRLDKYLADMGCGTRSQVKQMIRKGQVEINGEKIKKPEQKITTAQDRVCVAGTEIRYEKYRYYLLHKPAGYVSATTDNRDKTVLELLPENIRRELFPVGRLDKDTEGLLLITNDGALAHDLLSPAKHVEKTYYAVIDGVVTEKDVNSFENGVDIGEEKLTKPGKLRILKSEPESEIELTITEGRFHQVKRMFEAVGKKVLYLKRISMGPLQLTDDLKPGEYRPLTEEENTALKMVNTSAVPLIFMQLWNRQDTREKR